MDTKILKERANYAFEYRKETQPMGVEKLRVVFLKTLMENQLVK